jgi:hypothetical protein
VCLFQTALFFVEIVDHPGQDLATLETGPVAREAPPVVKDVPDSAAEAILEQINADSEVTTGSGSFFTFDKIKLPIKLLYNFIEISVF